MDIWLGFWSGAAPSTQWQVGDLCVVQFNEPKGGDLVHFRWAQTTAASHGEARELYDPWPVAGKCLARFRARDPEAPRMDRLTELESEELTAERTRQQAEGR